MEAKQQKQISQTDLVIQELYDKLSVVSQRVEDLESTKLDKQELAQELERHYSLIDDLQSQYERQKLEYKENIKIASKMLQQIKKPIDEVSNSLQKMLAETKETAAQKYLSACLLTLKKLKQQCSDSNVYFNSLLAEKKYPTQECSLQNLFLQLEHHKLYPLIKQQTSSIEQKNIITNLQLLESMNYKIFEFLYKEADPQEGVKILLQEISPDASLNNKWNICISFYFKSLNKITWSRDWQNSISYTENETNKIPLELFFWKKELNLYQGDFFIEEKDGIVEGFSVVLPFEMVS